MGCCKWLGPSGNPPLDLSCSPVRVQSRNALSSDLHVCKTWQGEEEKSRKAVAFLRRKQPWPQSASKPSLTACISLARRAVSPGPSREAERPLCPARGTQPHPHLHPPSAPAFTLKPAPGGGGGASQAALTPRKTRQAPAIPMLVKTAPCSAPAELEGLWRGSREKQRCKGGRGTRLGSPRGSRALDPSPKEETW